MVFHGFHPSPLSLPLFFALGAPGYVLAVPTRLPDPNTVPKIQANRPSAPRHFKSAARSLAEQGLGSMSISGVGGGRVCYFKCVFSNYYTFVDAVVSLLLCRLLSLYYFYKARCLHVSRVGNKNREMEREKM